jgi:hypothetical protein
VLERHRYTVTSAEAWDFILGKYRITMLQVATRPPPKQVSDEDRARIRAELPSCSIYYEIIHVSEAPSQHMQEKF